MTQEQTAEWLDSFRKHRHDILNGLQLVQGYLQMQKYDAALGSARSLSDWLQQLSVLQSQLHIEESAILQVASVSPHVTLTSLERSRPLTTTETTDLCALWIALEEVAAATGEPRVGLSIEQRSPDAAGSVRVHCTQTFRNSEQAKARQANWNQESCWEIALETD